MDSKIIVENALDAIITVGADDGIVSSWNPAAEKVFGWSASETINREFSEIIVTEPENDDQILPESRDETFKDHSQRAVRHKNGSIVPIEFSISHVLIDTRKIYVIFACDVSQRWFKEKKLQHAYQNQRIMNSILNVSLMQISLEDQLDLILDLILSIPTIKLLPNGAILLTEDKHNSLSLKVHRGFSEQQLATCNIVPFGKCHCGRAAESGAVQFVECIDEGHDFLFANMKPHGHYCVPIMSGDQILGVIALYIEEGHKASKLETDTLIAIANVLAGVIERTKMEWQLIELVESLKETIGRLDDEKKFNESIIGSLDRGLFILDKEERIEKVNPAGQQLIKRLFNNGDIEGKKLSDIFSPEVADEFISLGGLNEQTRNELRLSFPGSNDRTLEYNTVTREDASGRALGKIVSLRDITSIKKLQAEMEKMNRFSTIAEIASAVAHEVRNPLAGIKTMAQVIDEQIQVGDKKKEYTDRIIKQVDRLNEMLTEFFTYARPPKPQQKKLSVPKIIDEIKPLVHGRLIKRGIKLQEDYPVDLPEIMVDPNQVQQVFLNLFLNSIDAIKHGGEISIEAEYIGDDRSKFSGERFAWLKEDAKYVVVSFTDDGCGLDDEVLENIFEPFYTTKHDGSGLGLAIVFRILKENNAGIFVDNKRKNGTRMRIFFKVE